MKQITEIIVYSLFAGITIFLGGLLATTFEKCIKKEIKAYVLHWTIAFGGGILAAAVAFVLIPKAIETFSVLQMVIIFAGGALTFFLLDQSIAKRKGVLAQTMAMMMDFIPEAIALGATFMHNHRLGMLLAFFIGLQNLPESFNAYFDLRKSKQSPKKVLLIFFLLSFLGVFAAMTGRFLLLNHEKLTQGLCCLQQVGFYI